MKVTLKNGMVFEAVNVEESYNPRNNRGTVLSIRANSAETVENLRDMFSAEAITEIHVQNGDADIAFTGYTVLDSVRKFYDGQSQYNTTIDLVRE